MAENSEAPDYLKKKRLIINYLPQNMTDFEFQQLFTTIGPLETSKIMRDQQSGYSFGYGFITYKNMGDYDRAIQQLNGWQIQNKKLKVSYARPPGEQIKDTNLYIQNLPKTYQESDVEDLFAEFGQIVQKSLLSDKITGMPRGVAFVRYDKKSEADAAIAALNGQLLDGAMMPLNIKLAEEHGKQKAAYFAGLQTGMTMKHRGGGMGGGMGDYRQGPPHPMPDYRPPQPSMYRQDIEPEQDMVDYPPYMPQGGFPKRGRGAFGNRGRGGFSTPGRGVSFNMGRGRGRYNPMGRGGGDSAPSAFPNSRFKTYDY